MAHFLNSLTASGRFLKIHHHFPEYGHSFMPFGWAFAHTEKIKRRAGHVFVPEEWYHTVSSVSKKFSVVRVDQDMILDSKQHLQPFIKKMIKNETASFTISRYWKTVYGGREVSVSSGQSNMVGIEFCRFKTKQKSPHLDALKAYQGTLPLNAKKLRRCHENGPEIRSACLLEVVQQAYDYTQSIKPRQACKVMCHTITTANFRKNYDLKLAYDILSCYFSNSVISR
jgi:hypothetical protein